MEIDDSFKDYVERRFEPMARHFDREGTDLHVVLESPAGASKKRPVTCSARINLPGHFLVARKRGRDAFAAVDAAEQALQREVEKTHHKVLIGTRYPKKYYIAERLGVLEPESTEASAEGLEAIEDLG